MILTGKHLIRGDWIETEAKFTSKPAHGEAHHFSVGSVALVDQAARAAEDAFWSFSKVSRDARAAFLNAIADEIEARIADIIMIGTQETGLPAGRIEGETGRTTGQLRMFARHIVDPKYDGHRHDVALPERAPMPRPDIQMIQRPIGPVGVFGASNFPLAFSVAGGDTASALAAGCPVVVRGHDAHPGTGEIVAQAIDAAVKSNGLHPGVFSLIQGGGLAVGQAVVEHPLIQAIGFTGSLKGGRALFDLCAQRPVPIPFYGELGSVNPMFLLPMAMKARGADIGKDWAASLTMGAGQFCTNPGVALVLDDPSADAFQDAAVEALQSVAEQVMLTDGIAAAFHAGQAAVSAVSGCATLVDNGADVGRSVGAGLFATTGDAWLKNKSLQHEVFGPLGIIVRVSDMEQLVEIAMGLEGQLTCTLQCDDADNGDAQNLLQVLERKAGRILANGFPTGVEVCDAMVHGGPYPASTNFGATSVGTLAIERFLRPVCFQNLSPDLLPTV